MQPFAAATDRTCMTRSILAKLFPDVCVGCGLLLRDAPQLPLCSRCAPECTPLARAERSVDGATALFAYEGPLAAAVSRLKFGGDAALAGPLGRLLATTPELRSDDDDGRGPWDLLAPVPLHPLRALRRGYDQATLLTIWLARAWPGPDRPALSPRLLRRTRPTLPQTELDRDDRLSNLRGAFAVRASAKEQVRGRRVLLVDDVTTTGATLHAGRTALLRAGAASVDGLALLRALP